MAGIAEGAWAVSAPRDGNGRQRPPDQEADQSGLPDRPSQPAPSGQPDRPERPGQPERPEPGSVADLRRRLAQLPRGHPSTPVAADGTARPGLPALSYREALLADRDVDAPDGRLASDSDATGPPADRPPADRPPAESMSLRGAQTWRHEVPRLREMWEDLKARWPREANPQPDRSGDDPGSWRGDSGRLLSASQNRRIDAWCDNVSDCEQRITQRLEEVEGVARPARREGVPHQRPRRTKRQGSRPAGR